MAPLLGLYKEGWGAFFYTTIDLRQVFSDLSLSLSPSSSGLPLFGVCTRLGISPPYARRRAAGIGIRIHLLSAARLVRSPEGTSGTPYACNPARHYTCGAPSSSRSYRDIFTDNVPTGTKSRHRSTRTGWPQESSWIFAASGIAVYDYINHVHAGTFPA